MPPPGPGMGTRWREASGRLEKHTIGDKQGNCGQVRDARGEDFVPSLLRGHPQHSPEDLHVGHNNEDKTPKYGKDTKHNKPNFPEIGF